MSQEHDTTCSPQRGRPITAQLAAAGWVAGEAHPGRCMHSQPPPLPPPYNWQSLDMAETTEEDVGIRLFVNSAPGFTGILKHRFTDAAGRMNNAGSAGEATASCSVGCCSVQP